MIILTRHTVARTALTILLKQDLFEARKGMKVFIDKNEKG